MQILVTDGGPHPPEKWAHVSADEIMALIEVAPSAPKSAFRAKRRLEGRIFDTLIKAHSDLQVEERRHLTADSARLHADIAAMATVAARAWTEMVVAEARTDRDEGDPFGPFEEHFNRADVQEHIFRILKQHFGDSIHIERHWHADRNPDNPHVKAYRAKHNMG
jgi:hypothetical protein